MARPDDGMGLALATPTLLFTVSVLFVREGERP